MATTIICDKLDCKYISKRKSRKYKCNVCTRDCIVLEEIIDFDGEIYTLLGMEPSECKNYFSEKKEEE